MGLTLTFLGSGDAFGSGGRLQTCMLVEADSQRLLIDCGTTSLVALRRAGIDPASIDAILISHLHGDHFGGVPFLLLDGQFRRGTRPLVVAGPPGVEARVAATMEALFPGATGIQRRFTTTFVEWREREPIDVAGARVVAYPVMHPSGAPPFALRVQAAGRTVVYSGDTEWTDILGEAARGADLFVCEAYTFERKIRFHLDWATVAAHRADLQCGRLVVTHMSDDMLARLPDLAVEAARDGLTLEV
jgi:ribonuclease BN (tRNA processing enzyme)